MDKKFDLVNTSKCVLFSSIFVLSGGITFWGDNSGVFWTELGLVSEHGNGKFALLCLRSLTETFLFSSRS